MSSPATTPARLRHDLLHRLLRSLTAPLAAWRGLTRAHWAWATVAGLVLGVGNYLSMMPFRFDDPIVVQILWHIDFLVVAWVFLLALAVVEHVEASGAKRSLGRYLVAIAAACFVSTHLTVVLSKLLLAHNPNVTLWGGLLWTGLIQFVPGGLATFVYVRLRDARRAAHALANAQLEQASASRRLLASRLSALQAQVEPRFLFNTLDQVQALYERDVGAADRMLDELIAYLRAALPRLRGGSSTLAQEAELVRAWLAIVQVRMGSRLAFGVDIPVELAESAFPPMLLLPLVDNAVRHGLEPLPHGGRIAVSATTDRQTLTIRVADDGVGQATTLIEGPGLKALRERLAGLYGTAGRLLHEANHPRGLVARLEVPHESARDHR